MSGNHEWLPPEKVQGNLEIEGAMFNKEVVDSASYHQFDFEPQSYRDSKDKPFIKIIFSSWSNQRSFKSLMAL